MSVHLTDKELHNYHLRDLDAESLLRVDFHLTECTDCRKRLRVIADDSTDEIMSDLRSELQEVPRFEDDHISYKKLESFVDRTLNVVDVQIVQSHLLICEQCRSEANDLGQFAEVTEERNIAINEMKQTIPFRRSHRFKTLLSIAGAAAMIILFVWVATLPFRDRIKNLNASLEQSKKQNDQLAFENSQLKNKYNETQDKSAELQTAPVFASLNDKNGMIRLYADGNVDGLPSPSQLYKDLTKNAFSTHSIETPAYLSELVGKEGLLLADENAENTFVLKRPVGTAVKELRPAFQWTAQREATGYDVRIYDLKFREIASSGIITETHWTASKSLPRGQTYMWHLTAYLRDKKVTFPNPPEPEAKFHILSAAENEDLEKMQNELQQSHLISALVFARFGLLDDAENEFKQLVNKNPDSKLTRDLLQQIQSIRNIN